MDSLKIIFVYIGLIIGAGFASGREICEYFNFCSNSDYGGIIFASLLFSFICYIILKKSAEYSLYNIKDYVCHTFSYSKILQKLFLALIFADLAVGLVVMLSSFGEIISARFEITKLSGSIILALLCAAVFIFDIRGIAAVNIILVPIIILTVIVICLFSILSKIYSPAFNPRDFFMGFDRNILLMSVFYVSYNTLTAASVLSPLSKTIKSKKNILIGSAAAGFIIGLLIFLVWLAVKLNFKTLWYESFPLKKLAGAINNNFEDIYSLCLIFSIFTTAVSEGYGILSYFKPDSVIKRGLYSIIIFAALLPLSRLGFSYLVKNLYFVMGALGTIWTVFIITDFLRNKY